MKGDLSVGRRESGSGFSRLLWLTRHARRVSQAELAKQLGYRSSFIVWQWENDVKLPTAEEAAKLAEILSAPYFAELVCELHADGAREDASS